jgi:hypothetical protein
VRRIAHLLALGALLLALTPSGALAAHHKKVPAAVAQVWSDCTHHNSLQGHYSAKVLEQALADLPTDDKEYSLCADEIQNAEAQGVGGSHRLPSASSSEQQNLAKNAASLLKRAQDAGDASLDLGGRRIAAGTIALRGSSFLSDLPTPLLIVLAMLFALASVPFVLRIHRLVRARRPR